MAAYVSSRSMGLKYRASQQLHHHRSVAQPCMVHRVFTSMAHFNPRRATLALLTSMAVNAFAIEVVVTCSPVPCGGDCNGSASAMVIGGTPPYTFEWSPAPPGGQGLQWAYGLCPGYWSVTVTDALGETAEGGCTVTLSSTLNTPSLSPMQADCMGMCQAIMQFSPLGFGGIPPYQYTHPVVEGFPDEQAQFQGLCAGWQTIEVSDASGCSTTLEFPVGNIDAWIQPDIVDVFAACGGEANGAIMIHGEVGTILVSGPGIEQYHDISLAPILIGGLPPGTYEVSWYIPGVPEPYCHLPAIVEVENLPEPCGSVNGLVFHDADQNCELDGDDLRLPYRVLAIDPGDTYAITDANGAFHRNLGYGSHTIAQALVDMVQLCPAADPVPFTIDATTPQVTIHFADSSTVSHDLAIHMNSTFARPGFPTTVWLTVQNASAYPSGALELDLSFDPLLLSPDPANGHWSLPALPGYGSVVLAFHANVPADAGLLGQVLAYSATVDNATFEEDLSNNMNLVNVTITGAYDPNDKQGWANASGSTTQFIPGQDNWIDYLIRFQNTGTDTAFNVVVIDEIDPRFDLLSLQLLGASHAFVPSFGEGRELIFTFTDIMLPDSTTDLAGSQGFVAFRLKPVAGLLPGDVIPNTAAIYFDFNDPIITNTTEHVVETSTAVDQALGTTRAIRLVPNPATDVLHVWLPNGADRAFTLMALDGRILQVPVVSTAQGIQLNVSTLAPGTYLIRTSTGTVRVMKQ